MEAIEVIAIVILIIAVLVLIYYYLMNSPKTMDRIRGYVPASADAHMDKIMGRNSGYSDVPDEESDSVTDRIKVKLNDIDISSINTDAFSKKLDAFLDEKSEELIKNWSLATTDDLDSLEAKFLETTNSVDALEKDYLEFKKSSEAFQKSTEDKLAEIDQRIEALEK